MTYQQKFEAIKNYLVQNTIEKNVVNSYRANTSIQEIMNTFMHHQNMRFGSPWPSSEPDVTTNPLVLMDYFKPFLPR